MSNKGWHIRSPEKLRATPIIKESRELPSEKELALSMLENYGGPTAKGMEDIADFLSGAKERYNGNHKELIERLIQEYDNFIKRALELSKRFEPTTKEFTELAEEIIQ